LTARWQRFLIVPRYAYRTVFQSKFFTIFFVACFFVPVGGAVLIYLRNNLNALGLMQIPADAMFPINAEFFSYLLSIQGVFAFLLTVLVGPGLVSPDLVNNALPLYLSRPFSKVEYVIGKMSVLLILLSAVTWVPLGILFFLQANLAGIDWLTANTRILGAICLGSLIWILVLALLALAISAWVRWRAIASALLFGVFFVSAGFGAAVKELLLTRWGDLFNLNYVIQLVWTWLFFGTGPVGPNRVHGSELGHIPVWSAWVMLICGCGICLVLLARKIKAYEVVR
jgi:ABC-2 type transport system permease protein